MINSSTSNAQFRDCQENPLQCVERKIGSTASPIWPMLETGSIFNFFNPTSVQSFVEANCPEKPISSYSFGMTLKDSSKAIKGFNANRVCSEADVLNQDCAFSTLRQVQLTCSKNTRLPAFSFQTQVDENCIVQQISGDGKAYQINFSNDEHSKLKRFLQRVFPKIFTDKFFNNSSTEHKAGELFQYALGKNGVSYEEEYKVSPTQRDLFITVNRIIDPLKQINNNGEIVTGVLLGANCNNKIKNGETQPSECSIQIEKPNASPTWKHILTRKTEKNGNWNLCATNNQIIENYTVIARDILRQNNTVYGERSGYKTITQYPNNSESFTGKPWSFNETVRSVNEVCLMHIIPACVGLLIATSGAKFLYKAANNTKVNLGRRAAGSLVGLAGLVLGLGITYERARAASLTYTA